MSDWVPLNDNHAIAAMAVFVQFADPIPDRTLRNALNVLEEAATPLGLRGGGSTRRLQVQFNANEGISAESQQIAGRVFARRDDNADLASAKILEQVTFEAERILYRTSDYISWQWHSERIKALLSPCIEILDPIVSYQAIGMEYLDRFRSANPKPGANLDALLRKDSELLAPHIFLVDNLFHCHTGAFVNDDPANLKLQSVKVDCVTEEDGRWVNIVTHQERKLSGEADSNPDPLLVFEEAHTDLKDMLARIITAEQADRIYLKA